MHTSMKVHQAHLVHLFFFFFIPQILQINKLKGNRDLQHHFSQSIYHNELEMEESKQNKINLEDNIDLMDEYNNENILDNNSKKRKY